MAKKNAAFEQEEFKALDRRFRENRDDEPAVEALNELPADDRAIMIMYVALGRNKRSLARTLGISRPVASNKIWRLQVVLKEKTERIMRRREEEEDDIFGAW